MTHPREAAQRPVIDELFAILGGEWWRHNIQPDPTIRCPRSERRTHRKHRPSAPERGTTCHLRVV